MLFGFHDGTLELRRAGDGATKLAGRFPYNVPAVLSDGGRTGRPQKEVIAPQAFAYRINKPDEDIHILVGHSFDKPLASRSAGTLKIRDTPQAVLFEAIISPEMQRVSYVADVLAAIGAGLIAGISPGFRIPPKRAVANAEKVEDEGMNPEAGAFNAVIRTVMAALLYELSLVTRPAYPQTQVEMRDWSCGSPDLQPAALHHSARWRA